jgi:hypothetical protein
MKTTPILCICAAVVALTGAGRNYGLEAAPLYISGSVSFTGSAHLDAKIATATLVSNFSNVFAVGNTNGSYSALTNAPATWMPLTFSPPTTPLAPLWSCDSNGVTYSFDATSMRIVFTNSSFLDIQGTGIAHITGYADTPGIWTLGLQQFGSSVSFSASTIISPTNLPVIYGLLITNGNFEMSWNALAGQPYQLQTTPSLDEPAWSNVVGVITTSNSTASASCSIGPGPGGFFRVALPPQ